MKDLLIAIALLLVVIYIRAKSDPPFLSFVDSPNALRLSYNIYNYPHLYKIDSIKSVYDGDTVKVILDRGFGDFKHISVRIYGVDTPEKRGPQAETGKLVQQVLNRKIQYLIAKGYNFYMVTIAKDKYAGRIVGDIFWRDGPGLERCVSDYILEHKLGKPYLGGKKEEWTEEQLQAIRNTCERLLRE